MKIKRTEYSLCKEIYAILEIFRKITNGRLVSYHIPNEGKRSSVAGIRLAKIGLRAGAPDYILCIGAEVTIHLEVKICGGRLSTQQKAWHNALESAGHKNYVIYSVNDLLKLLLPYMPELNIISVQLTNAQSLEEVALFTNRLL